MNFHRRLDRVLREMGEGPRIVAARFVPAAHGGEYAAEVSYDDGLVEILFEFDPGVVSFAAQELVGLTKDEALLIKDRKTDDRIGIEPPI
jgi:hypothetical protein